MDKTSTDPPSSATKMNKTTTDPPSTTTKSATNRFLRSYVPLPRLELYFYFAVWCVTAGYLCFVCFLTTIDYVSETDLFRRSDFVKGWGIFGNRLQDVSDFEWTFWCRKWSPYLISWFAGHTVISNITRRFAPKAQIYVWIVYSFVAILCILGKESLLLLLGHCAVCYLASLTQQAIVVWIAAVSLLSTLNSVYTTEIMKTFFPDDVSHPIAPLLSYHLLLFTMAMFDIRLISFCLERCNHQSERGYGVTEILAYTFYLPLLFSGPIVTYDRFKSQISMPHSSTKTHIISCFKTLTRQAIYILLIEILQHYVYVSSISRNYYYLRQSHLLEMTGIAFGQCVYFHMKYIVLFGVPSLFAKMDHVETLPGPACVARICTFSEMWRLFDRGYHSFIKRHIYIPAGGSRQGPAQQLLAISLCFLFIYVWHGTDTHLLIWCSMNFVGMTLEVVTRNVVNWEPVRDRERALLSPQMSRRLTALICVPSLCLSLFALIYFFNGEITGKLFYQRLIFEGWPVSTFVTVAVLYCACNASFECSKWDEEKMKKKQS